MSKKNRFDLEQEIMDCWKVTDDINMVTKHFIDSPQWKGMSAELADAIMNKYFAIAELYELKFQNLFDTFVDCIPDLKSSIEDDSGLTEYVFSDDDDDDSGLTEYVFSDDDDDVEDSSPQIELRLNDVTPAEWNSLR